MGPVAWDATLYDQELADTLEHVRLKRRLARPIVLPDLPPLEPEPPAAPRPFVARPNHRGLCGYCGAFTAVGRPTCRDHRDLPEIEARYGGRG